jgi:glycosyltransferase involved in cell wall biosynthesis
MKKPSTAVVIPCYRVKSHILEVLQSIGPEVKVIYVVDDACPEGTGNFVSKHCKDRRVKVLENKENLGVGGAVITGYKQALIDGMDIIVKIDGDGQMDASQIPRFTLPLANLEADYTKGNRFFDSEKIAGMPVHRVLGNAGLSLLTKFSSGYWNIFDPTNGFTAINRQALNEINLDKLSKRYFFESDMLFRLYLSKAVIRDIPINAKYEDEKSNLSAIKALWEFPLRNSRNFHKRIFYTYFLRDMTPGSIEYLLGNVFLMFGVIFGGFQWYSHAGTETNTPIGTVMLSAIPIILGVQLLIGWITEDINSVPRIPLSKNHQSR